MKLMLSVSLIAGSLLATTMPAMMQPDLAQARPAQTVAKSRSYVGLTYRDLPPGLAFHSGWVVRDDDANNATYAASVIQQGQTKMLWFSRVVKYDQQGKPTFQVVDVVKLPRLAKSHQFIGRFCRMKGTNDPEIGAIVRLTDTEYYKDVVQAWRTNPQTEKIEPIRTRGIDCANQGWGV